MRGGDRSAVTVLEEACKSGSEASALRLLAEFALEFAQNLKPGECKTVCERLLTIVRSRTESEVRQKAAGLLKKVMRDAKTLMASFESDIVVQNLMNLRSSVAKDPELLLLSLSLWLSLCESGAVRPFTDAHDAIESAALEALASDSHLARCEALRLLTYCSLEKRAKTDLTRRPDPDPELERWKEVEERMNGLSADREPRVRAVAVQSLLQVARTGHLELDLSHYRRICRLLGDSSHSVRRTALFLIKHFAETYPEECVRCFRFFCRKATNFVANKLVSESLGTRTIVLLMMGFFQCFQNILIR